MRRSKNLPWPHVIAAVLTFCLYAVSLGGTYVYDDQPIVHVDDRLKDPHQWGKLWQTDYFNGGLDNLYRPLTTTSYAVEWFIHGDRPWAFHLVNCLLAGLVSALVVELCIRGTGSTAASLVAGVTFAALPIHVEAIANIVGRAELMAAAGVLGALIIFARRPFTGGRIVAIFACYEFAVLSKEQGLLVPPLLLLWGLFVWPRLGTPISSAERRPLQWLVLLMLWSTSIYLVVREHYLRFDWDRGFLDWTMQPLVRAHGVDHVLIPFVLLGHYIQLIVWPAVLSPDYGGHVIGWIARPTDPYLWLGFAVAGVWVATLVWCYRSGRGFVAFCLVGAALGFGMVCNFPAMMATLMAERLAYLPSAFLLMGVAAFVGNLPRKPLSIVTTLVVIAMSIRTVSYAARWNHPFAFWQQAIVDQPMSSQVYKSVAMAYEEQGNLPLAQATYARESELFPDYWIVWIRRANIAIKAGQLDDAERYVDRAQAIEMNVAVVRTRYMILDRRRELAAATRPASRPATRPR